MRVDGRDEAGRAGYTHQRHPSGVSLLVRHVLIPQPAVERIDLVILHHGAQLAQRRTAAHVRCVPPLVHLALSLAAAAVPTAAATGLLLRLALAREVLDPAPVALKDSVGWIGGDALINESEGLGKVLLAVSVGGRWRQSGWRRLGSGEDEGVVRAGSGERGEGHRQLRRTFESLLVESEACNRNLCIALTAASERGRQRRERQLASQAIRSVRAEGLTYG